MNEKILIVDDNPEDRYIVSHKLKQEGIPFDEAGSAEEALKMIERGGYTIVFVDLILPEMSGFDLISRLRAKSECDDIYLWVVSNIRDKNDIHRFVDAGADDYLAKPIDPMILQDKLRVVIKELDTRPLPLCEVDADKDYAKVDFKLPLKVIEFNEEQIIFLTEYIVEKGTVYTLSGPAFHGVLTGRLRVKVEECTQISTTERYCYRVTSSLYELDDSAFGLYRKWLLVNKDKFPKSE